MVVLYSALGTSFAHSFPIAITSTPTHLATSTIKCIINKWIFIYEVSELRWVTLDNNICTDKVERLLKLVNHGKSSFVSNANWTSLGVTPGREASKLFVGQANEIPELEESSEVGWKSLLIALVEHHLAPLLG